MRNYERIEKAIRFLDENYQHQPSLQEVAKQLHLSRFHLQRMFKEWAGVSPKKFLQFISLAHARNLLRENRTLDDVSYNTGLSGTGRLHDLFVNIVSMTPGEFKEGGNGLNIEYQFYDSLFGKTLIASTSKGVCFLSFVTDENRAVKELLDEYPKAEFTQNSSNYQLEVFEFLQDHQKNPDEITLHLSGTPFQLNIWKALLTIPSGCLRTYSDIAEQIDKPKANRAVGSAIGKNPVSFIIPCHRVIRSTGAIGNYRWGSVRKKAMIGWEGAKIQAIEQINLNPD
jgi:AraC family transcriptional regulator of adaptative response/methylated-DNA-[protein]-cysteine methyltransferase